MEQRKLSAVTYNGSYIRRIATAIDSRAKLKTTSECTRYTEAIQGLYANEADLTPIQRKIIHCSVTFFEVEKGERKVLKILVRQNNKTET